MDDVQRDFLSVSCTAEAFFEDGVSLDLEHNARKLMEYHVSRIAYKRLSISAFLQASMTPARHRASGSLSTKDVQAYEASINISLCSTLSGAWFPIHRADPWQ